MSSFKNLLSRVSVLTEGKVSPYSGSHPSFGNITSKMRAGGLSSAPLDTIKFIREILYMLDIIDDQELNAIKKAPGFTGKKQTMLSVLKTKQNEINAKTQEIADRVSSTLDDFISGVGVNRGKEEKYAAQAASQEIASQMRQVKSGKQMDDALTDIVSDETILVKSAVANILAKIGNNIGEPGFDIDEEALGEVMNYSNKITNLATLKSFIQQISNEPGYEKIAAYLSSAVKPISQGTEDEEMFDDEPSEEEEGMESLEMYDVGEDEYDSATGEVIEGEANTVWVGDGGEDVDGVVTYTATKNPRTGKIDVQLTGGYVTGSNPAARVDNSYINFVISDKRYNQDYIADALADAESQFNMASEEGEEGFMEASNSRQFTTGGLHRENMAIAALAARQLLKGAEEEESDDAGSVIEGEADTVWIGDDGEEVDGVVEYIARKSPYTGKIDIKLTGGYVTGNNPAARVDKNYIDFIIADRRYNQDYIADALADAEGQFYMASEEEESKPDYLDFDKDGDKDELMKSALKDKEEEEESRVEQVKDYTVHYDANGNVKKVDHSDKSAHIDPALVNKYLKEGFPLSRACAAATSYPNDLNQDNEDAMMLGESYTSIYITEQKRKDSYSSKKEEVGQSFKERYKPKTSYQLDELRRYGL